MVNLHRRATCTSTAGPPAAAPLGAVLIHLSEAVETRTDGIGREGVDDVSSQTITSYDTSLHDVAHGMGPARPMRRHERPNPNPPTAPRGRRIGGTVDLHQWATCTSSDGPHAAATLDAVLIKGAVVERRCGDGLLLGGIRGRRQTALVIRLLGNRCQLSWVAPLLSPRYLWPSRWRRPLHYAC